MQYFTESDINLYASLQSSDRRALGTFDHPLILGFFLVLTLLVIEKKVSQLQFSVLNALTLIGVFATESRTAFVALIVLNINRILSHKTSVIKGVFKTLILTLFLIVAARYVGTNLVGRFSEDFESSYYRQAMLSNYFVVIKEYLLIGGGMGSGFDSKALGLTRTSFENGWIILSINFGIIWTLFFFLWLRKAFSSAIRFERIKVGIVLVFVASNSGFGYSSAYHLMFFATLFVLNEIDTAKLNQIKMLKNVPK